MLEFNGVVGRPKVDYPLDGPPIVKLTIKTTTEEADALARQLKALAPDLLHITLEPHQTKMPVSPAQESMEKPRGRQKAE